MKSKKQITIIYIGAVLIVLMDQVLKILISHQLLVLEEIKIIPQFFSLQYVQNTGAAFGIFENNPIFLAIISLVILVLLTKFLYHEENISKFSIVGYSLLVGGLVGNLIDRIVHGFVIDYLSFNIFGYGFPVFNLADIGIVVGLGILIIDILRGEINERIRSRKSGEN